MYLNNGDLLCFDPVQMTKHMGQNVLSAAEWVEDETSNVSFSF